MGARYLRILLGTFAAGLLLAAAANAVVDPFDLFGWVELRGFNHYKRIFSGDFERMRQAQEIARRAPDAVVLGTSREDGGIDPGHPRLRERARSPWNASLSGCTVYEARRYLEHAQAVSPLSTAVVGIQVEMFLTGRFRSGFTEERLAVDPGGRPKNGFRWADCFSALWTLDALSASRRTVRDSTREPGFTRDLIYQREAVYEKLRFSENDRFPDTVEGFRRDFSDLASKREALREGLPDYEAILVLAHRGRMGFAAFIPPYHAALLDLFREKDWEAFQQWKRDLLACHDRAGRAAGREPFPLWDFSGYNVVTTEPPPPPGEPTRRMRYHYEGGHYRRAAGDRILETMLGRDGPKGGFGRRMTPANVEGALREIREERARFHASGGFGSVR